jgi:carboxymethylenebutenolidase
MGGMIANAFDHSGIKDLRAALTYLAAQPNVDPDRLGTIGFCLGGNFAICWACKDNRLKVIAPFYAANPLRVKAVEDSCPVVGSYPEKDWTAPCGRKLDRTLDNYGIKHDIKIYPGAKHSFFYGGRHVDEQASADAWKRTLTFFKEEIG